ncbi:MAG: hypothetical protein JW846_06985 [Dehalococcoidia bacterium]|nr:hypothetical protein [Dehalococcoidia bacterium]
MTTPQQRQIRDKTITASQWADMVQTGDWIYTGGPGSDPVATIDALCGKLGNSPGKVHDIELWTQCSTLCAPLLAKADPEAEYCLFHEYFFNGETRRWNDQCHSVDWGHWGWSAGMNYLYSRWARRKKDESAIDWAVVSVAPPENGLVNFSYGVANSMTAVRSARKTVVEIREDYAWCEPGRNMLLPIEDVDYFVEVDLSNPAYRWPEVNESATGITEADRAIARHILSIMGDGDCLQIGIGGIPLAVALNAKDAGLKHLGVHTEMGGEWMFTLIEAGCIDNSRKSLDPGRCTYNFMFPLNVDRYKQFLHHNSFFAGYDSFYTNNIATLSKNDHAIGINGFLAMDLYGQDACGLHAGRPVSGTGGQFQFIVGCAMAKGGRGVLAATSRDAKGRPRFVPNLPPGTIVDVPSQFVSWVATENGIVNLSGKSQAEKAHDIINVLAHPDDRESLERAAHEMHLLPRVFKLSTNRRYPDYWKDLRDYKHLYASEMWGWEYQDNLWSGK